jgi:hypothetical protein
VAVDAKAIQPDKTGRAIAQADLAVRVGAKADAEGRVEALRIAIDRDNTDKHKYYVGTNRTFAGYATGNPGGYTQLFSLNTKVTHRSPGDFHRNPTFKPASRLPSAPPASATDDDS